MTALLELVSRSGRVLLLTAAFSGCAACSSQLATTQGPFRDLAQPGPCVIDSTGSMRCWGGARTVVLNTPRPKRLLSARDWVCAESESGTLSCWGRDVRPGGAVLEPVSLAKLNSPIQVSSHANAYCALQADRSVACWGVMASEPRLVAGVSGALQVEVRVDLACALLTTGGALCWGVDDRGPGPVPVREIPGLVDAQQISLGTYFGCAVLRDGGVSCWGTGNMGELGQPVTPFVHHPATRVPGLSRIAQVVTGGRTACARSVDGVVSCWGRNMACELGVKKRKVGDLSEHPLVVQGLEPSQKLSFNGRMVCSLSKAGNLTCWGECLDVEDNDPSVRLPPD